MKNSSDIAPKPAQKVAEAPSEATVGHVVAEGGKCWCGQFHAPYKPAPIEPAESEREKFEQWFIKSGYAMRVCAESAWLAGWQAARATPSPSPSPSKGGDQ